nr:MAG TPA: protein yqbN [Caudoviricetes sp.]
MAKIQLEDLLNRNMKEGFESKDVYVKGLGGELTVIHQPLPTVLRLMDNIKDNATLSTVMDAMVQLIYNCVPLFKNKDLQAKYECAEPTDVVYKVLNDSVEDITALGEAILAMYGMTNPVDEVKKQ